MRDRDELRATFKLEAMQGGLKQRPARKRWTCHGCRAPIAPGDLHTVTTRFRPPDPDDPARRSFVRACRECWPPP